MTIRSHRFRRMNQINRSLIIKQGYGNTDQKIEAASRLQSRSDQLVAKTSEKIGEVNKAADVLSNSAVESTETEMEPETEKDTGIQSE